MIALKVLTMSGQDTASYSRCPDAKTDSTRTVADALYSAFFVYSALLLRSGPNAY